MRVVHLNGHPARKGSQYNVGCNRGEFPVDRSGYRWIFLVVPVLVFRYRFMFRLAVPFEEGDIVGGGFDAQHMTHLVVNFD